MVELRLNGKYSAQEKKELEIEMDQKALEWYALDEKTDGARRRSLWNDIFTLAMCRYSLTDSKKNELEEDPCILEDKILDMIVYTINKYDPSKGKLSHFMSMVERYRKIDSYNETHSSKNGYISKELSYDQEIENDEGDNIPMVDTFASDERVEDIVVSGDNTASMVEELFTLVYGVMSGMKKHETPRCRWFRIFYTENITDLLNKYSEQCQDVEVRHERDVMRTLNIDYLDFYMSEPCECIDDIKNFGLKLYDDILDEVDEKRKGKMIEMPLGKNPIVSLTYLNKTYGKKELASNRSNFRNKYITEFKELLGYAD